MTWDEEGAGRTLGTRMKLLSAPAHRVHLDEVVRAGRRANRLRRLGTGAAVLALAGAVAVPVVVFRDASSTVDPTTPASSSAAPVRDADCTIQELPRPAGTDFAIEQVDPSGRIMLGISSAAFTLLVWDDGQQPSTLAVPGARPPWPLAGVNSRGVIIGSSSGTPWLYREDRTVEWLVLPPDYTSGSPTTINDNGDVAGNVAALQSNPGSYSRAAIWPADARDRPVVLEPDLDSTAVAIGPDRTVVGMLLNYAGHQSVAVAWTPDGERRVLDLPSGWSQSRVTGIAGDFAYGQVTRDRPPAPDDTAPPGAPLTADSFEAPRDVPARWNLRTGKVEILSSLPGGVAAVAASGWFVVGGGQRFPGGAVVVSPKLQASRLPMPPWSVATESRPVDIEWVSSDGRSVAGNVPVAEGQRPVVWRCR